jgi:hypothetical protein
LTKRRTSQRGPPPALSQGKALAEMRDNYKIAEKETGVAMDFSDVPNILCEPDEYRRVKLGEGNRRALCAGDVDDEPTRAPLRRLPWRRIRQRSPRVAHPTSSISDGSPRPTGDRAWRHHRFCQG